MLSHGGFSSREYSTVDLKGGWWARKLVKTRAHLRPPFAEARCQNELAHGG